MTKNERLELNKLSKQAYGTSSKWQKMVTKGERGPCTEKLDDGTERTYQGIVRYSIEEVNKIMEELIKEEAELKAAQEKEALEEKKKREAQKEVKEVEEKTEEAKQDVVKEILETVES